MPPKPLAALAKDARKTVEASKAALAKASGGKYDLMREGQIMDGQECRATCVDVVMSAWNSSTRSMPDPL